MKRQFAALASLGFVLLASSSASAQLPQENIIVANRGSGNLTVIDTSTDTVRANPALPIINDEPEPMYVVFVPQTISIWVSDRENNVMVALNSRNYFLQAILPTGANPGHVAVDRAKHNTMWVVNEDNTITVIAPKIFAVLGNLTVPGDLTAQGGFAHDVFLDNQGKFAYVTVWGIPGRDVVVRYDTSTLLEAGRADTGDNSHVTFSRKKIYAVSQVHDAFVTYDATTMVQREEFFVAGGHGLTVAGDKNRIYISNFPGGGTDALWVVDSRTEAIVGGPVDTPFPSPHNLAMDEFSRRLYVTHSGATSNKVTVYQATAPNPEPVFLRSIDVGLNPWGVAFAQ